MNKIGLKCKELIPTRTRYYSLDPVGIGTPLVESMTSYVVRLAAEHRFKVSTLIQPHRAAMNIPANGEWLVGSCREGGRQRRDGPGDRI